MNDLLKELKAQKSRKTKQEEDAKAAIVAESKRSQKAMEERRNEAREKGILTEDQQKQQEIFRKKFPLSFALDFYCITISSNGKGQFRTNELDYINLVYACLVLLKVEIILDNRVTHDLEVTKYNEEGWYPAIKEPFKFTINDKTYNHSKSDINQANKVIESHGFMPQDLISEIKSYLHEMIDNQELLSEKEKSLSNGHHYVYNQPIFQQVQTCYNEYSKKFRLKKTIKSQEMIFQDIKLPMSFKTKLTSILVLSLVLVFVLVGGNM